MGPPVAQLEGPPDAEAGCTAELHKAEAGGQLLSNGDVAAEEAEEEQLAAPVQASGSAAVEPAWQVEDLPHDHADEDGQVDVGCPEEPGGKEVGLGSQPAADADASMEAVGLEAAAVPTGDQETMQEQQEQQQGEGEISGAIVEEDAQIVVPADDGAAAEAVLAPEPSGAAHTALDDTQMPAEGLEVVLPVKMPGQDQNTLQE